MLATKEQIEDSSYIPDGKGHLRVSKSSFMTYLMCPRKFYWQYVAGLPQTPAGEAAIRGGKIHSVMEDGLLKGSEYMKASAEEHGVADDLGVETLEALLHQIASDLGSFEIVEAEVKHQLYENYQGKSIIWVGMIDGLIRVEGLGLVIVELKTGKMNTGKLGRTRKELVYYRRMLQLLGKYEEPTHFLYITPDYEFPEGEDKLLREGDKRGKRVWLGDEQGIAILEPIGTRSINAFEESLSDTISDLRLQEWPMKWSDYFCPLWCEFCLNCEQELTS
jgi:hypothetical protein